ncbi:MAG: hypothetical protein IT337_09265 [Thermomicrobiales bacterium]|nr:hypothetical protein [Thermomicrobiales bacterium]
MGTDIHMWAEIRKSYRHVTNDEQRGRWEAEWHTVGRVFENEYFRADMVPTLDEDGEEWGGRFTAHPYQRRNYDVFAMLAGVRNGMGFAGCDTGDGFVPIAEPRGFPADLSVYMRRAAERVEHTPSWLNLSELESYDWTQRTRRRGWVELAEFLVFQAAGKPHEWSGGVSGGMVAHVSNAEMGQVADGMIDLGEKRPYTQVEWGVTYAEAAGSFYTETLPKLREIRAMDRVIDLRIVFWFDS